MKNIIISRITEGMFRYQGWPTVCKDEKGTLYCASSGHRLGHICPYGKDILYRSTDGGETWSNGMIINDTCLDDRDAGLLYMGNGRLLLTWFDHPKEYYIAKKGHLAGPNPYGHLDSLSDGMVDAWLSLPEERSHYGSFVRISNDYGNTWGDPISVPVTSPHGPLLTKNGKVLYVGKGFNVKPVEGVIPVYGDGEILCFESEDLGQTWNYKSTIPLPDGLSAGYFHEPHACELPSGRILGSVRVEGKGVDFGFTVYTFFSDDGGLSWSVPEPTGICGSPPHLLVHSSGAVIMTYGRRVHPEGERARISLDGGKTFGTEISLGFEGDTWDLGYPSSVELDDGSILTAYYQRFPGDNYCSVLGTKWKIGE